MKLITDHAELTLLFNSNNYSTSCSFHTIHADGSRPSAGGWLDANRQDLQPMFGATWDSPWWLRKNDPEAAKDADYFVLFKHASGIIVYIYECGGYSSMTFEPDMVMDWMPNGTLEAVENFCFDDGNRKYLRSAIAQLVLA